MKRVFSLILCVAMIFLLGACDLNDDKKALENVSDLRNYYFVGNSDNYFVEMYGGKRETPLTIDGHSGKLTDYVKIKVLVKSGGDCEYAYHIGINEEEYEGVLTKEVAGGCYVATICAKELEAEYTLKITANGKTESVKLVSKITAEMITFKEAREIAEKELKDSISNFGEDGYEVYIKFIEGEKGSFEYFWYVAFMDDKTMAAVLINPLTKKVVARRS